MLSTLPLRRIPLLALLIAGLLGVGCDTSGLTGTDASDSGDEDPAAATTARQGPPAGVPGNGAPDAEVRVGHLSPDAPAVDVYVNTEPGEGEPTIRGLEFPNFAPNGSGDYLGLAPGTYDIAVTPAGGTAQVIDVDGLSLSPNTDYSVLAVGELEPEGDEPSIQALPLVDDGDEEATLPPADKTLVRFVHASPDAGSVDIAVDGTTVLSGVSFGTASSYLEVAPGERTVEVLKGGEAVLTLDPELEAGTKITAYVTGNAASEEGDASLGATTTLEAMNPPKAVQTGPGRAPVGPDRGSAGPGRTPR